MAGVRMDVSSGKWRKAKRSRRRGASARARGSTAPPRSRAFEVAVHDELERRARVARDVVVGAERRVQRRRAPSDLDSPSDVADLEFLFVLFSGPPRSCAADLARAFRIRSCWCWRPGGGRRPRPPELRVDPDVVFLVFLPPLLAAAALLLVAARAPRGAAAAHLLAVGLVLVTMGGVAVAAHALIDGLSWAAAFVLGAVVAPTDPVAAPPRSAAARARAGRAARRGRGDDQRRHRAAWPSASPWGGDRRHLLASPMRVSTSSSRPSAGVAIGLAAGWIEVHVLRKLDDRPLAILLTLLFAVPRLRDRRGGACLRRAGGGRLRPVPRLVRA